MKFFFDANLSIELVKGLRGFGEDVEHLTERFPGNTPDEGWLEVIGREGLTVVTKDIHILSRPNELAAFKRNRVGAFVLAGKGLNGWQLILQTVKSWQRIKELSAKTKRPFAFKVRPGGEKVEPIALS